eukprot:scaffold124615_cov30-Tisochrysis_lutea.AAC.2
MVGKALIQRAARTSARIGAVNNSAGSQRFHLRCASSANSCSIRWPRTCERERGKELSQGEAVLSGTAHDKSTYERTFSARRGKAGARLQ